MDTLVGVQCTYKRCLKTRKENTKTGSLCVLHSPYTPFLNFPPFQTTSLDFWITCTCLVLFVKNARLHMLSSSKIDRVFASLNDCIIVGDNDLIIYFLNHQALQMFGWMHDEVRGKSITFLLPSFPMEVPHATTVQQARHRNGQTFPVIAQTMRDPQATMVAWSITPIVLPPTFDFTVHPGAHLEQKLGLDDLRLKNRKVLVRTDYNVPIDKTTGLVRDDTRLRATLPTIQKIIRDRGTAILISHLGRPKKGPEERFSLKPVANRLSELLGIPVQFAPDATNATDQVSKLKQGEVLLLENIRFYSGETSKDPRTRLLLAEKLASYGDLFVSDAFGTAHRDSASMTGIPRVMGAGAAGYLMEREVRFLSRVLTDPPRPLVAIVGGSKVSDKFALLGHLFTVANIIVIGGAMAYTFLEAQGHRLGNSKVERLAKVKGRELDLHAVAHELVRKAEEHKTRLVLPVDHACASEFKDQEPVITETTDVPEGLMALDIGPRTRKLFCEAISQGKSCIWNGPVGVFEFPQFSQGCKDIANTVVNTPGMVSVCGGGETAAVLGLAGVKDKITHVSTGGGAMVEMLEGTPLPGLVVLTKRVEAKL